jgi:hypothetical protein
MQPNEELRIQCIQGYEWPDNIKTLLPTEIESFDFDDGALLKLASGKPNLDYFFLTFLSREYLELGLLWARCAVQAGVDHFAIAAADEETLGVTRPSGHSTFQSVPAEKIGADGPIQESCRVQWKRPGNYLFSASVGEISR